MSKQVKKFEKIPKKGIPQKNPGKNGQNRSKIQKTKKWKFGKYENMDKVGKPPKIGQNRPF